MARREYSEEFRRDAVKQVIENGYGIIETTESSKIKCGKKHFEALESDVELVQAKDYNNFMEKF